MAKMEEKENLDKEEKEVKLDLQVHQGQLVKKAKKELMVNQVLMVYQELQEREEPQVFEDPLEATEFLVKRGLLESEGVLDPLVLEGMVVNLEEMVDLVYPV